MNRAQRRQHMRRHNAPQRRLVSDHGRAAIVYDEATDRARSVDPDVDDLLGQVFPGLLADHPIHVLPGVSESGDVLGWAKGSIAEIRAIGPTAGTRVLVQYWCEHIRDEAAALYPFGADPALSAAFAAHPTAGLVVAFMPASAEVGAA